MALPLLTRVSKPAYTFRRGGRVVECTGLENRRARKCTGGSNPSLSAIFKSKHLSENFAHGILTPVCILCAPTRTGGGVESLPLRHSLQIYSQANLG